MRLLLLSDIHANPWALAAIEQAAGPVDHILCAGDTVSYGTDPSGAIAWLRQRDALVVRGNHDHAVATGEHPHAAPAKSPLALAMRDWTRAQLTPGDLTWLARRPLELIWEAGGVRFHIVHGTLYDPLYDYRLTPEVRADLLDVLVAGARANVLLAGHTHLPLVRPHRQVTIVNPGSAGQPLDGDPAASFAVWKDGRIELYRAPYDPSALLAQLATLPLPPEMRGQLANTLRTGRIA